MEGRGKKEDSYFMQLAFELARKAEGRTSPNPIVGAVIVKDCTVIGHGYHKKAGMPHAEIEAMNSVSDKSMLKGATMYTLLEPCCHYGRTGPCTKAIIEAGISRVVSSIQDPNPKVNGNGFRELKKHGIETEYGIMEKETRKLNEAFIKYVTTKRPFVILKAAMTLDGKIATTTGMSKWISSEASRRYVHELRNRVDAVIVGINTVLHDNPRLTCRMENGRDPLRIILDSRLRIPLDSRILADKNALIATTKRCDRQKKVALEQKGIGVVIVGKDEDKVDLKELMYELVLRGITNIMIEGGSEISASALKQGIVDKFVYFISPKIIGGRDAKTPLGGEGIRNMDQAINLRDVEIRKIGDDVVIEGYI
ncbi:riboflavin biosynthesis protein RibD [Candidatus Woesearchaeota archaeon CG10_big_fil_rev_8_21_14_0_10_44_13]|nr:MAG: riboflavin biosynthesis protein RibD [Candidatus Woesearchaeota archaeon CG10_big_fil_rev_8_21_14_0_10_44_13]